MAKHYDIDITLTTEAEDTEDQLLDGPLSRVGFGPTFGRLQEMAVKCKGSWADWEPYRTTYEFSGKDEAREFAIASKKAFPRQINMELNIWDDEGDE